MTAWWPQARVALMSTEASSVNKPHQAPKVISPRTELEMQVGAEKTKEYTERSPEFLEAKAKEAAKAVETTVEKAAEKVVEKAKEVFKVAPAAPAKK